MTSTRRLGVLLAATLLVAGCGGGGSEETSPEPQETASEAGSESTQTELDPASAELPTDTFCDDIDVAVVAQGLDMAPGDLTPVKTTAVGDKLTPGPGLPPMPATANSCEFGKGTGIVIGIAPDFDEDVNQTLVQEALNRPKEKPGKNTVMYTDCEAEETTVVGSDGLIDTCTTVGTPDRRVTVRLSGMAANAKITCYVQAEGKQADPARLEDAVADTCVQVMQGLAAG